MPTVAQYVETFLAQHEVRPNTVSAYKSRLRIYVVPYLGARKITEVQRPEYRKFFTDLRVAGVGNSSRNQVKRALSAMLSDALDEPEFGHLIPGNQVLGIRVPVDRRKKARLTWEHVVALAQWIDPAFEMLVWYGSLQGLRSMEAVAVRAVDMKRNLKKLEVVEQRQYGKAAPLKTSYSYAVIPMGTFLIEKYADHMARRTAPPSASALKHRRQRGWSPRPAEYDALVTVNHRGAPLLRSTVSRAFGQAKLRARAHGVMVPAAATFRDLRDFMDAVLIAAGVSPRNVQARMRHGTLALTLDTYGFALEVDWVNAPASFEELFGIPAPPGLPEEAMTSRSERLRRRAAGTQEEKRREGASRDLCPRPAHRRCASTGP
ncbi:hypothetical protein AB0M32_41580 [Streptomyces sp. NPDC051985]|uniref:tyrosine-type recombinase/integrase n=1 Tax=Streptomyces sp. NPDC051985 TaxID=3155807 RepID=UPI0034383D89